jgi:catechol 2,3-dioxygenase-like lactoylglutathione lyase family enzyme
MPNVLGIDHVAFAAHDLEATCAFYDLIGWEAGESCQR